MGSNNLIDPNGNIVTVTIYNSNVLTKSFCFGREIIDNVYFEENNDILIIKF